MRSLSVPVILLVSCVAFCQTPDRVILWDFEDGTDGWWVNPWSGGKMELGPAEGRYGQGLQATWDDTPGAGNLVSPFVPQEGPWVRDRWTSLSLWLKGDGTAGHVSLQVLCTGPEGKEIGYSRNLPMDSRAWRHFSLDMSSFWNREKVRFDASRLRRLLFSWRGTHTLSVDHIAIEGARLERPFDLVASSGPVRIAPRLFAQPGALLVRFFPPVVNRAATAIADVRWPGGEETSTQTAIQAPPSDDVILRAPCPESQSGPAELTLRVTAGEEELARSVISFDAAARLPAPEPVLGLLPSPKQVSHPDGEAFRLGAALIAHTHGDAEQTGPVYGYLAQQLATRAGITCRQRTGAADNRGLMLVLARGTASAPASVPWDELDRRGPEAYFLHAAEGVVTIAATDRRGLRHGAISFLQMALTTTGGESPQIPSVRIVDWPSLPVRGITCPMPTDRWGHPNDAPVDPAFFEEFLLRTCLEHKLNTVVILVRQGMKYARHPQIDGPAAWDQATVRRIVGTLKSHDINPIPLLDSLGHANWLVIPMKDLREDGDTHTLCTRHPDAKRILLDCYEEIINVFEPTHFHMGLDEIRWQTFNKPQEERCSICHDVDKREIFLEQVKMLHGFLTDHGITPMLWGDMVLSKHNGGPPFHLDETLADLPKDMVITNWSITLDPNSNHLLRNLGFGVIQSNSRGVTPAQSPYVEGNFFGVWAKHPWMMESAAGVNYARPYSYLSILTAAEYSWNLYPDPMVRGVGLQEEFFTARPGAVTRLGLAAPVGELQPVSLGAPAGHMQKGIAGRIVFDVSADPLLPRVGRDTIVQIGGKPRALYVLVAADVPDDQAQEFAKLLRDKRSWRGVDIAHLVMRYEDGGQATRPLRFGLDVRDARRGEMPYAYNAVDMWFDPQGRAWYALQLVNPHPNKVLKELALRHTGTEAQPMLKAVCVQD